MLYLTINAMGGASQAIVGQVAEGYLTDAEQSAAVQLSGSLRQPDLRSAMHCDENPPSALPRFDEAIGGSRRALSEPEGRVAQPPDCFVKPREPRRGSADGAAFFGLLFLAAQEK